MMKIGCDPEFLPIVSVIKNLPDPYKVAAEGGIENLDRFVDGSGYDYVESTPQGQIGTDAGNNCEYIGELRPKPGSPKQVVDNMRKMIRHLHKKNVLIDIIAGGGCSYQESLGGHIHFDVKLPHISGDYSDLQDKSNDIEDAEKYMVKALDYFVGLPLQKKKGGQRSRDGYGDPSDIRETSHGNRGGFEYRTPPSWLTSPELAEAVLWTAWAIVKYYQENRSFWIGPMKHMGRLQRLKPSSLKILKLVCPPRGKKMIDLYAKIIKSRSFDLAQKGAITNWTGKKVTL